MIMKTATPRVRNLRNMYIVYEEIRDEGEQSIEPCAALPHAVCRSTLHGGNKLSYESYGKERPPPHMLSRLIKPNDHNLHK